MPDNPFWYKRNNPYHNFGSATVADSIGDALQPRYIPEQKPVGIPQYSASPMYSPRQTIDDQSYGTSLPQSAIQKIQELNGLMNKYPKYHMNPDAIVQWAIHSCLNDDNTFLDDKLEQLRIIDRRLNGSS
ncbi:MAG: hypothetical protein WAM42_12180 [Candidatus Nitrosopolaris sp.]